MKQNKHTVYKHTETQPYLKIFVFEFFEQTSHRSDEQRRENLEKANFNEVSNSVDLSIRKLNIGHIIRDNFSSNKENRFAKTIKVGIYIRPLLQIQ